MRKLTLYVIALLWTSISYAQLTEHFSDGNFTDDPVWIGNAANWTITASGQLQSANTTANSTFWLSTANTLATSAEWEFYVRLQFNTSSANYVDVFLIASAADISLSTTTGYFVRIGNTQDEISLYRKDAGSITKIIDGMDGVTNSSDNTLKIKITRDADHQFTLYRDATGTGNTYVAEGTAIDANYTTSNYFGVLVRQSTSSFFQRHFFDDFMIKPYIPDVIPPTILSVNALSTTAVAIVFTEPVDAASSQVVEHYFVDQGVGEPVSAIQDAINPALIHLSFATPFANGLEHTITVNGVKDLAGNSVHNASAAFSFYTAQRFDVLIHEIMADPSPPVALPNAEYIELRNRSGRTLNLQGWRIATRTATSSAFPAYELPPDGFLIITSNAAAASFASYGPVLGVGSFPALDNSGTIVSLRSREGNTIHAVEYSDSWYGNAVKKEGGWSLEMVDAANPCAGNGNWKASTAANGGTPGQKNAVEGRQADHAPPQLVRTYSLGSDTLALLFNEPLDSVQAVDISKYQLEPGITVISARVIPPLFNTVELKLAASLQPEKVYNVHVKGIADCTGNRMDTPGNAPAGLPSPAATSDIIVNEILFNPKPGVSDYVELYNNSKKILDLSQMYLANRNTSGEVASLKKLSDSPLYCFPGDFIALTEDKAMLQQHYFLKKPDAVRQIASLPSYPDDKGVVVIVNSYGNVVDEVAYSHQWHFSLMSDKEGVALERIDPAGPSNDKNNWHSAASTSGYGTPGYQNSQYRQAAEFDAELAVEPKVFSPDHDGIDDVAIIQYALSEPGYVANITLFDASGKPVRQLVRNALLGLKGRWIWDGLNDKGQSLHTGTYIVFAEIFNLQGKRKVFKQTIVLARRR